MELKTKFNVNDIVWFMEKNKPVEEKIWNIEISIGNNPRIKYIFFNNRNNESHRVMMEKEVFSTKEELLKSL
jgi:hypothetical protein